MRRAVFAALSVALLAGPAAGQAVNTVVTATGLAAPGGGTFAGGAGGPTFNAGGPTLNANGQIAFFARVSGGQSGVFLFSVGGAGVAVARQGQTAPGGVGQYAAFATGGGTPGPALNDAGQVAFRASLSGGAADAGIFRYTGGGSPTTVAVALAGATAPDTGGVPYTSLGGALRLSATGQVAFYSTLGDESSTPADGVFRGDGVTAAGLAVQGSPAAGSGSGTYVGLSDAPRINAAGQVAVTSGLEGGTPADGVFRLGGAAPVVIARQGDAAAGGGGLTYDGVYTANPQVNAAGQVAFAAALSGPGNSGVFRSDGVTGVRVALVADAAPGPGGGFLDNLALANPQLNAAGQVAFFALTAGGTSTRGVFVGDGGALTAIARQGMAAPGTAATFRELSFDSIRLNDAGVVAFRGQLTVGGSVTAANDSGLWFGTSTADLALIAREGDSLFVNGQNRVLRELPARFDLSEFGLAWRAEFTDGTFAVIYTELVPVPEPAAALGLAAAALGLAAARPRLG